MYLPLLFVDAREPRRFLGQDFRDIDEIPSPLRERVRVRVALRLSLRAEGEAIYDRLLG